MELKPCPFCGSEVDMTYDENYESYFIMCDSAGCGICCDYCDTEEEAGKIWNKRIKACY